VPTSTLTETATESPSLTPTLIEAASLTPTDPALATAPAETATLTLEPSLTPTSDGITTPTLPAQDAISEISPEQELVSSVTPVSNLLGRESLTTSFTYNPPASSVTRSAATVAQLRTEIANADCTKTTIINLTGTSPYTVTDAPAGYNFYGANGFPVIRCDIVIQGGGKIIQRFSTQGDPGTLFRLFAVDNNADYPYARLTLDSVTVRYGRATQVGGAGVFNFRGTLRLRNNARIVYNTLNIATSFLVQGAGVYTYQGRMTIVNSYIAYNVNTSTLADGGGIAFDGSGGSGLFDIRGSIVENNTTYRHGAGMALGFTGNITINFNNIRNNVFTGGTSARNGSAMSFDMTGVVNASHNCINGNTEVVADGRLSIFTFESSPFIQYSWWGATSGPRHPINPGGTGQGATDQVNVYAFLTTSPLGAQDCRQLTGATPTPTQPPFLVDTGLLGRVFPNMTLTGNPVGSMPLNQAVNYDWGYNAPIAGLSSADQFSIRWTGFVDVPQAGTWRFWVASDDGFHIFIDEVYQYRQWVDQDGSTAYYVEVPNMRAGLHPIKLEYYDNLYGARISLRWERVGSGVAPSVIPASSLFPIIPTYRGTPPTGTGLASRVFTNPNLQPPDFGQSLPAPTGSTMRYDWGTGKPIASMPSADNFSIVWEGFVYLPTAGTVNNEWSFWVSSNDGFRLYIDGEFRRTDRWVQQDWTIGYQLLTPNLTAGFHWIRLEYFEGVNNARIKLEWQQGTGPRTEIPIANLYADYPDGGSGGGVCGGNASTGPQPLAPLCQVITPTPNLTPTATPATPAPTLPPTICIGTFPAGGWSFNVYNTPSNGGTIIASVTSGAGNLPPSGVEILGVHPNSAGDLWYRLGIYRTDANPGGWTIADSNPLIIPNNQPCNNLPLMNSSGQPTAAPAPTTDLRNICLFILASPTPSYTIAGIRDRTNETTNSPINIGANVPVLVTAVHLNQQYVKVSYNNSAGVAQSPRWIKFSESQINFNSPCVQTQAPRIVEADLPTCNTGQVLNCRPSIPISSPRIFNGAAATIIAPFGDPVLGCGNDNPLCYGDPNNPETRPCRYRDISDSSNCGIDLTTGSKAVYVYSGGLLGGFSPSSGTLSILVTNSSGATISRFNYTHINQNTFSSALFGSTSSIREYVASGINIGLYGPIGAYGSVEHVDSVAVDDINETYAEPPWN
jgi:hypothetical protein